MRNLLLEIENNELLTDEPKSLIYSIGLRIGFGGRESDMQMIFDYSIIWYNKFKLYNKIPNEENNVGKWI